MNINEGLFIYINQYMQNSVLDAVMPIITHFGGFIWLILIVFAIFLFAKVTRRETLKKVALLALIALLVSDLIALLLKQIVQEPRPFVTLENVRQLIPESDPCSFPSGHATSTLAVVSIFLLNMDDLIKKHQVIIDIALAAFAIVIMFSRLYVGVHYPFDVLCGALIGIVGAFTVNYYKDRILSIYERIIPSFLK